MATGNTLFTINPLANNPPTSNFAQIDRRNNSWVLNFDAATNWDAIFRSVLNRAYSGNGITVTLVWCAQTATSGDVVWNGAFERDQDGTDNIDSDSFAAAQSVTSTAPGTAGIYKYATLTFTNGAQMDSLAAGEAFRFKLTRNAAAGGDTMTGLAQMVAIEARET